MSYTHGTLASVNEFIQVAIQVYDDRLNYIPSPMESLHIHTVHSMIKSTIIELVG